MALVRLHVTVQLGRWAMPVGTGTLDMMHSKSVPLAYYRIRKNTKIYSNTQYLHVYGSICRYLYVLCMYIYVYVHMTVMLSYVAPGLRLFHPSATALSWNSICMQPFYQWVLVWTWFSRCECARMRVASRNACAPSSRLCTIIFARQTMVAEHCSDRHEIIVSPQARSCTVCGSTLAHLGEIAPSSSRRQRHHSPGNARPRGCVLSTWHVQPSGIPWHRKPPVLHQLLGHDLAGWLQEGWPLRMQLNIFVANKKMSWCAVIGVLSTAVQCHGVMLPNSLSNSLIMTR